MEDMQNATEQQVYYRCRVNIRPSVNGHKVRESVMDLNGFEVTLECYKLHIGSGPYPDEAIFTPCNEQVRQMFWKYGLKYLAEGDVTILGRATSSDV